MKVKPPLLYLLMIFFFFCQGCTKEEPDSPREKIKVRKPINRPSPPKASTGTIQEIKTEKAPPGKSGDESRGKQGVLKGDFGYYTVMKGENLSGISAKEEVYGDPLKWPILLRLNMDKFASFKIDEHLPEITLPQGTQIRFLLPEAARKKAKEVGSRAWVINVMSAQHPEEITLLAINLLKKDYCAYITRARVKGEEWMRLRVGFYQTKADAMKEKSNLDKVLDIKNSWIERAGSEEMEGVSGCRP